MSLTLNCALPRTKIENGVERECLSAGLPQMFFQRAAAIERGFLAGLTGRIGLRGSSGSVEDAFRSTAVRQQDDRGVLRLDGRRQRLDRYGRMAGRYVLRPEGGRDRAG